jgi:hypothetical protein
VILPHAKSRWPVLVGLSQVLLSMDLLNHSSPSRSGLAARRERGLVLGERRHDGSQLLTYCTSMGPRLFSSGNNELPTIQGPTWEASMGPRLFSRGNCDLIDLFDFLKRCFNGATTFPPWKYCGAGGRVAGQLEGFNGATTFPPWKYDVKNSLD